MSITFIKQYPKFRSRSHIGDNSLLFFDPRLERGAETISDRFRSIDASNRQVDQIVMRGRTDNFIKQVEASTLLRRFVNSTPLSLLVGSNINGEINLVTPPGYKKPALPPDLSALRTIELEGLFLQGRAIYKGNDFHFVLPSGEHAPVFIRVGNALTDIVDVQRVSDWILPTLTENSAILADTGSLLPLLLTIQSKANKLYGWKVTIDTLPRYTARLNEVKSIVSQLVARAGTPCKLIVLVSVNSSGRLAQLIKDCLPSDLSQYSTIIICDTDSSVGPDPNSLLTYPVTRYGMINSNKCKECSNSHIIGIDRQTYEILPSLLCTRIPLTKKVAGKHQKFWSQVDKANAIKLHVNEATASPSNRKPRHHAIWFDIPSLLLQQGFRDNCVKALAKLSRPDLVIIPRNTSDNAIRLLIAEVFPNVQVHSLENEYLNEATRDALRAASCVLVADDALIEGYTTRSLRQQIYKYTREINDDILIQCFVVIARPTNSTIVNDIKQAYTSRNINRFEFGYSLQVPVECPWCNERSILSEALPRLTGEAIACAQGRVNELLANGFDHLLMTDDDEVYNGGTPGSFFGNLHRVTAFAASSVAAYEIISDFDEHQFDWPPRILDLPKALVRYYFDALFIAGIIRTLDRRSLRNIITEERLVQNITTISDPVTLKELVWSGLSQKVPLEVSLDQMNRHCKKSPTTILLNQLASFGINQ